MFTTIIIMLAGVLLGVLLRNSKRIINAVEPIVTFWIYVLLFLLGISVGTNKTILNNLSSIGFKAALISVGAVVGSVAAAYFLYITVFKKDS